MVRPLPVKTTVLGCGEAPTSVRTVRPLVLNGV